MKISPRCEYIPLVSDVLPSHLRISLPCTFQFRNKYPKLQDMIFRWITSEIKKNGQVSAVELIGARQVWKMTLAGAIAKKG